MLNGLLALMGLLYVIDVVRNHDRLDPWLDANNLEGPLPKILILSLPAAIIGFVYWRLWKGSR